MTEHNEMREVLKLLLKEMAPDEQSEEFLRDMASRMPKRVQDLPFDLSLEIIRDIIEVVDRVEGKQQVLCG